MRRRDLIAALAGLAATGPLARAQTPVRVRRIAYVSPGPEEPRTMEWEGAFERGLTELGWAIGRDLVVDRRWGAVDPEVRGRYARELAAQKPEVIVAVTPTIAAAMLRETGNIPMVFVDGTEASSSGLVADRSRPGGNVTGFINFVDSIFGKWVQLLKEIAPDIDRVAYTFDPDSSMPNSYPIGELEAASRALNIKVSATPAHDDAGIEAAFAALRGQRRGGMIAMPGPFTAIHRRQIIASANRHRVPAIYPFRFYVKDGGLISYGIDELDLNWRAASYVDRILKGANPGDLPVQAPTKFELVVNVAAAKAAGIEIPQSILLRADDIIE
jgi:putative tryptophan/tyrosine transport system substrate-binding protein